MRRAYIVPLALLLLGTAIWQWTGRAYGQDNIALVYNIHSEPLKPAPAAAVEPLPSPTPTATQPQARVASTSTWYAVDRVVDGDTVVLDMDGRATKVRIIGIDTPEVVDPKKPTQCYGPEAAAEAAQLLSGKTVRFETDPSQGTYDIYHRRLGYLFLPDGTNYQIFMLTHGFAREYTFKKPYRYQREFKEAQAQAQASGAGLWGACPR